MPDDLTLLRALLNRGPCTRYDLADAYDKVHHTGLESADRLARKDIEEARRSTDWGALIIPDPYRLARTPDELQDFIGSQRRRALSILVGIRQQRRRGLDYLKALPLEQGRLLP